MICFKLHPNVQYLDWWWCAQRLQSCMSCWWTILPQCTSTCIIKWLNIIFCFFWTDILIKWFFPALTQCLQCNGFWVIISLKACTQRGLVCRKSSCGPSALHRQTVTLQRQWSLDPALVTFRPNIMHEPLMTEESCKEKSCNASLKSEAQQSRLIDDQPSLTLMRHCCPRPGPVHCIQEFLLTAPLSLILFAFSTTGTVGFNYFATKWYRWKIGVCN